MSMKRLLFFFLGLAAAMSVRGQLGPGSMAPDFTVNAHQPTLSASGMNGDGSYTLYDYLDAGYTVYAEFTSTLCAPCWNFHQEGVLEELYANHGPLLPGHSGVEPTSTNDVMVIWIDAASATPDSWMTDGSPIVNGNWIDPHGTGEVPFPMCNPAPAVADQLMDDYMVPFYPTLYRICPNRTVEAVWDYDPEVLYAASASCPQPSGSYNPSLLNWKESGLCPLVECVVTLQNMGDNNLTAADIVFRKGADVIQTVNWTGNLATYHTASVYLGTLNPQLTEEYTAEIVTPDDDPSGNVLTEFIGPTPVAAGFTVGVEITTDAFGNETRWELQNLATGAIVSMQGPFAFVQPPATVVHPVVDVTLEAGQCYVFTIFDADGMNNGAGNGSYALLDEAGNVIISGGTFTGYDKKRFIAGGTAGTEEEEALQFGVYPNPATDMVHVQFEGDGSDCNLEVRDVYGRMLYSSAIATAKGMQTLKIPTAEWNAGTYLISLEKANSFGRKCVIVR